MQPFRLSNLVVLAALVCTGAAIKCYEGLEGTQRTVDCQGTCSNVTYRDSGITVLGCKNTQKEIPETCTDVELEGKHAKVCFCNSNYCNAEYHSSSTTSLPPLPSSTSTPIPTPPSSSSTSLPSLLLLIPLLFSFMPHVF